MIDLPDLGIPLWSLAPVEIEVGLSLFRGDLCASREFFDDYAVGSLDELLVKFMRVNPYDTPLSYRFRFEFASISYRIYLSGPLLRRTSLGVRPYGLIQGAAPWQQLPDDTILELFVNESYRRSLRVGGISKEETALHWARMAKFFRSRIRALRKWGRL